jgi:hypothetical protein
MNFGRQPFFPFLFVAYPILYLYSGNIVFLPIEFIARSLIIAELCLVFFLFSLRLILRDWTRAGVFSSVLFGMFFSYGHIENLIQKSNAESGGFQYLDLLHWAWILLFFILCFLLLGIKFPKDTALILNLCSLILIIQPCFTIVSSLIATHPGSIARDEQVLSKLREDDKYSISSKPVDQNQYPDIYFIILDGYERPDQLKEYYQFDVSPFIQSLSERGFYVADQARSNYLNTTYSINTSMNLYYFQDFPVSLQKIARYNLQTNYVSDFLKTKGYQIVVFDSGTGDTNNQYTDVFISPTPETKAQAGINAFESLFMQTTILKMLFPVAANDPSDENLRLRIRQELDLRRSRIDSAFEHLPDYAADDQPQLLFAHIYSPHIPFLYGAEGKPLAYGSGNSIDWYAPAPEDYIQQYDYQVQYLNTRILDMIDQIQSRADRPTVILIQSDHGDDHYLNWLEMDAKGVDLRSSILDAVYYSDGETSDFYPTITSVNTFRNVLNHWFGTSYPLLKDRVQYHAHSVTTSPSTRPRFYDACKDFGICVLQGE